MTAQFLEIRDMFEAGRRYLNGQCCISELNGYVAMCLKIVKMHQGNKQILELVNSWHGMVNRYWNEWGTEKEPLSEAEFRQWLQDQLDV